MAQLHFYYATMAAGKSALAVQQAYAYQANGMKPLVVYASVVDPNGAEIRSRNGTSFPAISLHQSMDLIQLVLDFQPDVIIIDEAQFVESKHIQQAIQVVDQLNLPVFAFGLLTTFTNEIFKQAQEWLAFADVTQEIGFSLCGMGCGRKGKVNAMISDGQIIKSGDTVQVGQGKYKTICRACYLKQIKRQS